MTETIKQILMRRDNMTEKNADDLISEATDAMNEYLSDGDMDSAEYVCEEYFGLEPDYIMELM